MSKPSTLIVTHNWLEHDAVGNDVKGMATALQNAGVDVHVYAGGRYDDAYADWQIDRSVAIRLAAIPETRLIYHHSIGSEETQGLLRGARSQIRVLRYHNVTPPRFYAPYDPVTAALCAAGRQATMDLAPLFTHFSVPSFYNARDLVHAGANADAIHYQPCLHTMALLGHTPSDPTIANELSQDRTLKVLFVGRRAPHKGHLHLLATVAAYVRRFDSDITLHLAGGSEPRLANYDALFKAESERLGINSQVVDHGAVNGAQLIALYKGCDAFLCLSEHEGFGVPVLEAQYCGLPVIAYYSGGIPEVLGPAQPHWLAEMNYDGFAEALRALHDDRTYAKQLSIAATQFARDKFAPVALKERFLGWFDRLEVAGHESADHAPNDFPADRAEDGDVDERWYMSRYPDVGKLGMGARAHYNWIGKRLCRWPAPPSSNTPV